LCATIFLAAWLAPAQQPPQPAADPATASIEGRVLDAATGEPIRKAEVELNGVAAQGGEQTYLTAGTDTSGRFAFRALPPGTYWLDARHPGYAVATEAGAEVTLPFGERKSGIEIRLSPRGSIGGKVVDEFGAPVANCPVNALEPRSQGGRHTLRVGGSAATNDRGEYLIQGLDQGRYYVSVRCDSELEAPHGLMPARDPGKPTLVYAPQFYPGVPEASSATRLRVALGTETQGVDFQLRRVSAVTVRVRVEAPDPSVLLSRNVHVQLLPPSLGPFDGPAFGAAVERRTGELLIRSVVPGSYVLVAQTYGNGPLYHAQLPLRIGTAPTDPIHVVLARAREISGTMQMESDNPPALDRLLVMLEPLGGFVFARPGANVNKDGTFTLADVTPGRWRLSLSVEGVPYIKSLSIGDKDVSPYGFDLAPGTAGPIRILASTKTGQVQATTPAAPAEGGAVGFLLVPADPDRFESGQVRAGGAGRGGQTTIRRVVPGRYRLFAFGGAVNWGLLQQPEALKALEGRGSLVEVGEGETVQATAEPIAGGDLERALQDAQ
jgi:hypothetical protein